MSGRRSCLAVGLLHLQHGVEPRVGFISEEGTRTIGEVHHGGLEEERAPIARPTDPQATFLHQSDEMVFDRQIEALDVYGEHQRMAALEIEG